MSPRTMIQTQERIRHTIKVKQPQRDKHHRVHPDATRAIWAILATHRATYFEIWLSPDKHEGGEMRVAFAKKPMLFTNQEAKDLRSQLDLAWGDCYSFDVLHMAQL